MMKNVQHLTVTRQINWTKKGLAILLLISSIFLMVSCLQNENVGGDAILNITMSGRFDDIPRCLLTFKNVDTEEEVKILVNNTSGWKAKENIKAGTYKLTKIRTAHASIGFALTESVGEIVATDGEITNVDIKVTTVGKQLDIAYFARDNAFWVACILLMMVGYLFYKKKKKKSIE